MSLPFYDGSTLIRRPRKPVPNPNPSDPSPTPSPRAPERDDTLPSLIMDLSSPSSQEDVILTPAISSRPSTASLFASIVLETRPEADWSEKVPAVRPGARRYTAADAPHPFAVGTYPRADYSAPCPPASGGFRERSSEARRGMWAAPELTAEPEPIEPVPAEGDVEEEEEPWSISRSARRPLPPRKQCEAFSWEVSLEDIARACLLDPWRERVHETKEDIRLWGFRTRQSLTVAKRKAVRRVKAIGSA